jgi:hypothetical protein
MTQPAAELSSHVAVIQHRDPFAVADITGGGGRAEKSGQTISLCGGGRLTDSTCSGPVDSAGGPGTHPKVTFFALFAALFAAAFEHIPDWGTRLLLKEPLAVQESQEIHQGSAKAHQVVAKVANARVTPHTDPPSYQACRMTMVQLQLRFAKAAITVKRARVSYLITHVSFPVFFAYADSALGLQVRFPSPNPQHRRMECSHWANHSTSTALLHLRIIALARLGRRRPTRTRSTRGGDHCLAGNFRGPAVRGGRRARAWRRQW